MPFQATFFGYLDTNAMPHSPAAKMENAIIDHVPASRYPLSRRQHETMNMTTIMFPKITPPTI